MTFALDLVRPADHRLPRAKDRKVRCRTYQKGSCNSGRDNRCISPQGGHAGARPVFFFCYRANPPKFFRTGNGSMNSGTFFRLYFVLSVGLVDFAGDFLPPVCLARPRRKRVNFVSLKN